MTLGERIKHYREAANLDPVDLAARVNERVKCREHDIWRFENDRNEPRLDTLRAIADALEVSLDDLKPQPPAPALTDGGE